MKSFIKSVGLGSIVLLLAGCGPRQEGVRSYSVPKEDYSINVAGTASPNSTEAGAMEEGHQHSRPHVHWELPPGWEERATGSDGMVMGRFRISGGEGKVAEVVLMPMPNAGRMADLEEQSLDMWRSGLELETNAVKRGEVEVAGVKGRFYDLENAGRKVRLLAGVFDKEGTLWFVRMSGEASVVGAQQEAFKGFLKSLDIHEEAHETTTAAAAAAPPKSVEAKWPAAEGWTAVEAGNMVLAAYSVGGGKANVTVTSFPGDVGGMLSNVNRWRGQVGLGPISEGEVSKFTKELTLKDGSKGTGVQIEGNGKVSYTIVVKRDGNSWFYKILGDAGTVAAEKERLAEFAARAK